MRGAHPRSRGENVPIANDVGAHVGSSPLTRGKRGVYCRYTSPCRLIPAHAGKTLLLCVLDTGKRAHPRSRGENLTNFFLLLTNKAHPRSRGENKKLVSSRKNLIGSSPLTRGKPNQGCFACRHPRLIPAHAGKTRHCVLHHKIHQAHPRSRGENSGCPGPTRGRGGSSPLTRGKRPVGCVCWSVVRLIPAHAGKTHPCGG